MYQDLKYNLKSMMINILIHIVWLKHIERMIICKGVRQKVISIHSNQMCCMKDRVQVDDVSDRCTLELIWPDYPHPSVFIQVVINAGEPLDEGTRIGDTTKVDRKEEVDTCNVETMQPFSSCVCVDKDTAILCNFLSPWWHCSYTLVVHTTSAT